MSAGTLVALVAAAVSLAGIALWLGLLLWAAREDGRSQREYDRQAGGD
ncbi:MAG: hypothetical protein ACKVUT_17390 [Gaiella sp.]